MTGWPKKVKIELLIEMELGYLKKKKFIIGIYDQFWTGLVDLDDHLNKKIRKSKGGKRNKRGDILPYQCVWDKREGFRCFNPGTAIAICETSPLPYYQKEEVDLDFNVMVVADRVRAGGGNPNRINHAEVVHIKTLESCSTLPTPYPLNVTAPVAMTHESKLVICGGAGNGLSRNSDCYSYSNDNWNRDYRRITSKEMARKVV